ncbi:MAG: hypothetical protein Q9200_001553 [Gallowayella weberi]
MLCNKCESVVPALHDEYSHSCLSRHHACFQDLIKSADRGCELCQVFRPYVEREVEHHVSLEPELDWYGWNEVDPFKEPYPEREYLIMGSEDEKYGSKVYYVDFGTHFEISGTNVRDAEQNLLDSICREIKDSPDYKRDKKITPYCAWDDYEPGRGREWLRNHCFDNHEIFQWLFFTKGLIQTGPEQLWIVRQYRKGDEPDRGSCAAGQRESISTLKMSAGSIDLDSSSKYCYQGNDVGGLEQLAILLPGLWRWRCIPLGDFEFYNESNRHESLNRPWQTIVTKPIQTHASLPTAFEILKQWLRDCKTNHSHCAGAAPAISNLPTRLIDVGQQDGEPPHLCRNDHSQRIAYTILSHCNSRPRREFSTCLELQTGNLNSLQERIQFDSFSKDFQDAIIITRALGLKYLWAERLCVLQDSTHDREKEGYRKSQYYAGSEICIAATASPHAEHGILHPRTIGLNSARLTGEAQGLGIRPLAEDIFSLISKPILMTKRPSISYRPLSLQCSALLERLQSKRIVHYTEQQMVWQCQTCIVGEDGQIGEDRDRFARLCSQRPFDFHLRPPLREITGPNENEHGRYPDMTLSSPVEGHTGVNKLSGSIGNSANYLPLLSPFAKEIAKWTKATYIAGLWELDGQIPFRSLLWYSEKKNTPAKNESPSWSWSSVLGPVEHPHPWLYRLDHPGIRIEWIPPNANTQRKVMKYDYTDSQIEVLSVKADLKTSDLFGQVQGGELRITGLVHSYKGADQWKFAAERWKDKKSKQPLCLNDIPDDQPTMTRKSFPSNAPNAKKNKNQASRDLDPPNISHGQKSPKKPHATNEEDHETKQQEQRGEDEEADKRDEVENTFTLTEYLDTEHPNDVPWTTQPHLLLLVAEFRDQLDSFRPIGSTPRHNIQFLILRQCGDGSSCYTRIGVAKLRRRGGQGLFGVHSAYCGGTGWRREGLVVV